MSEWNWKTPIALEELIQAKETIKKLQDDVKRLDHLHKLDHSLANQWQTKNEKLEDLLDDIAYAVAHPTTWEEPTLQDVIRAILRRREKIR